MDAAPALELQLDIGGADRLDTIHDGGLGGTRRCGARRLPNHRPRLLAAGAAGAVGAPASLWLMSNPRTARAYR